MTRYKHELPAQCLQPHMLAKR